MHSGPLVGPPGRRGTVVNSRTLLRFFHDKNKHSPIQLDQNFKMQRTAKRLWSVCTRAQGCQSLVAKLLAKGLIKERFGSFSDHLAPLRSVERCVKWCDRSWNEKFCFERVGNYQRVVVSLLDCGKRLQHRAAVSGWNRGVNRASLRSFRHAQSRIFRSIVLVFLVCHFYREKNRKLSSTTKQSDKA